MKKNQREVLILTGLFVMLWCSCHIADLIVLYKSLTTYHSPHLYGPLHHPEPFSKPVNKRKFPSLWWWIVALLEPSHITLTVFVNETAGLRPVWNTNGYMNGTWIQDRVDYSASEPHQVEKQLELIDLYLWNFLRKYCTYTVEISAKFYMKSFNLYHRLFCKPVALSQRKEALPWTMSTSSGTGLVITLSQPPPQPVRPRPPLLLPPPWTAALNEVTLGK